MFEDSSESRGAPSHQAVCKLVHVSSMMEERKAARNEVVVLSWLKHPNIIEYNDSFEEEGTLHILIEYAQRRRQRAHEITRQR